MPTGSTGRRELGGQRTVLVVEDDAEMRFLIRRSVTAAGYAVREAPDGGDALEQIADLLDDRNTLRDLDLIVADVRMPRFSGLALLDATRQLDPSLPFILITAFGDRRLHELARRLGVSVVLDKPLDLRVLVHWITYLTPAR